MKHLLAIFLSFLISPLAEAAVAFDSVGTAADTSGTAASATNMTVGTGSNRAIVAQVTWFAAPTGITVTWDPAGANQALTLIKAYTNSNGQMTALYGLVNPTSGTNKSLTANWTGSTECIIQGVSWTGVNQSGGTTSFPNSTQNNGNNNSATITINSAVNNATMDSITTGFNSALNSVSATQTFLKHGSGSIESGGSRADGASSVTMTGAIAGTDVWGVVGTDIQAADVVISPCTGLCIRGGAVNIDGGTVSIK